MCETVVEPLNAPSDCDVAVTPVDGDLADVGVAPTFIVKLAGWPAATDVDGEVIDDAGARVQADRTVAVLPATFAVTTDCRVVFSVTLATPFWSVLAVDEESVPGIGGEVDGDARDAEAARGLDARRDHRGAARRAKRLRRRGEDQALGCRGADQQVLDLPGRAARERRDGRRAALAAGDEPHLDLTVVRARLGRLDSPDASS